MQRPRGRGESESGPLGKLNKASSLGLEWCIQRVMDRVWVAKDEQ